MRRLRPPGAERSEPVEPAAEPDPGAAAGDESPPDPPAALRIGRSADTGEAPRPVQGPGPISDGTKGIVGGRGSVPKLPPPKAPKPPGL
jgi:hypothetical protein